MARKIFIAATGQNCGKTTTSLSLMHLARKKYKRVGFIKPLGPKLIKYKGRDVDMDAALIAKVYGLDDDIELMSPVVLHPDTTRKVLAGEVSRESLMEKAKDAFAVMEEKYDFLIVEGAGHSGVGAVVGLNNAVIAQMLGAPVMMVAGGGIGNVIDAVHLNLALFREAGAQVVGILPNKLLADKRERTLNYLTMSFGRNGISVVGGFNFSPILAHPTLRHIAQFLDADMRATKVQSSEICHHIQLGAASCQRVVDILKDSTLLVVTGSRDELLVTIASLYHIHEYRQKLAGVLITGTNNVSPMTQKILDDTGLPYIRCPRLTADVFTAVTDDVSKITADDSQKIRLVQSLAEKEIDFEAIDALLD
jgi:BioD-like phosphotransacetylase family protein